MPNGEMDDRLRANIEEELRAQFALLGRPATEEDIPSLARSIASNVDYAFAVTWSPRWDEPRS